MRQFSQKGLRIDQLSLEARILYSSFCVFAVLAMLTSFLYYRELVGESFTNGVNDYYAGQRAAPSDPEIQTTGPAINLPNEPLGDRPIVVGVTYRKLLEVTHFHLFTLPVFLLIVAHLFVMCLLPRKIKIVIVASGVASSAVHMAAPWVIFYGGVGVSWLMPVTGSWMMLSLLLLTLWPLVAMWRVPKAAGQAAAMLLVVGSLCLPSVARADVAIELPPENIGEPLASGTTTVGGYGELHYALTWDQSFSDHEAEIDLHRLVLFIGHRFTDKLKFMSEIEVEHALSSKKGEVGIEQAYVDWQLAGPALVLRAGVVLVPVGIINHIHEPPTFHGVERPSVDKSILPTTWREGGVGVVGQSGSWSYQGYVIGGLDAGRFSGKKGLRDGRQAVSEARARGLAFAGRVEFQPTLGAVMGLSAYGGLAGPNAEIFAMDGTPTKVNVPVLLTSVDARIKRAGFEARVVAALGFIGDSEELSRSFRANDQTDPVGGVGSSLYGAYGEVAYDVFHQNPNTLQLLPFLRVEHWDTMATTAASVTRDPSAAVTDFVVGVSLRPIAAVVFKTDFTLRNPGGPGPSTKIVTIGTGFTY